MGIVAVMVVWAIASALGVDFTVSTLGMPIPAPAFVIFSIVGGVGAWVVSGFLLSTKTPRKTGQIVAIMATHFAIGVPLIMAMGKHLPVTK